MKFKSIGIGEVHILKLLVATTMLGNILFCWETIDNLLTHELIHSFKKLGSEWLDVIDNRGHKSAR